MTQFRRFHYYTSNYNDNKGVLYDEKKRKHYQIEYLDNDSTFIKYRFLDSRDIHDIFHSSYIIMKHFHRKEELNTKEKNKLLNYIRFYALRKDMYIYRKVDLSIDNVDKLTEEIFKYGIDPI